LQPLEVIRVEPRTLPANAFVWHLAQHHYLGFEGAAGQNLRYLLRDCSGRDLACVLFAAAAWKVQARDALIGWSAAQRQQRLSLIINNSRFLILPHVRVPHLASHILGTILRRVRGDWQRKYELAPCLAETFGERERKYFANGRLSLFLHGPRKRWPLNAKRRTANGERRTVNAPT
jgi:Domain of unknown function (DUF4338)